MEHCFLTSLPLPLIYYFKSNSVINMVFFLLLIRDGSTPSFRWSYNRNYYYVWWNDKIPFVRFIWKSLMCSYTCRDGTEFFSIPCLCLLQLVTRPLFHPCWSLHNVPTCATKSLPLNIDYTSHYGLFHNLLLIGTMNLVWHRDWSPSMQLQHWNSRMHPRNLANVGSWCLWKIISAKLQDH